MQPARISDCQLAHHELDAATVASYIELTFDEVEDLWGDAGSPQQKWYRRIATGKNAAIDDESMENGVFEHSRLIAWKKGRPFEAENLFFRTVDSGRLLPMHLADFRVQFYAHSSAFEKLDRAPGGRKGWPYMMLAPYFHNILILRNMHDKGGADIPIILAEWNDQHVERAMEYWTHLSKGEWSEEEERKRYYDCEAVCKNNVLPCFFQTNILVRALLSDPEVGYVPPFIILHSVLPGGKTCVLFTKPRHFPPPAIADTLLAGCNNRSCTKDCAPIDMAMSRYLVEDSHLVRKWATVGPRRVVCNLWGCEVQHSKDSGNPLLRCQRCKEVLYCSAVHQKLDWGVHKNVCEKRA
ncbi:hypothetical protein C8R47DRAFT_227848 [Mycena vitilis]|nr:hypothetical protein C8R47DRAFT_227848 [Mycena vitilis]